VSVTEALTRVDNAHAAAARDPRRAYDHLNAALSATGDLQRALILEQLALKPKPDGAR
jgi:hypothetical protein